MDQVAYYSEGIKDKQIKMLSEDVPCAEGFNGEGFAYFPGTGAESGSEMITTKAIPGCKPGPHTVRFRYLTSQANNVKLDVQSSDTTQPAKVVQFTEPEGYDDTVLNAWSTTTPATIIVNTETPLELTLSPTRGGEAIVGARRRSAARRRMLAMNNTLATAGPRQCSSLFFSFNLNTFQLQPENLYYDRKHHTHPTKGYHNEVE